MSLRLLTPLLASPLARGGFVAALVVVFILAMIPLSAVPMVVSFQDKIEHALAFAALMLIGWTGWPTRSGRIAAGLLAYGVLIELCQHTLTTNRVGDPWDVVADAVGIVIGGWVLRATTTPPA